MKEEVTYEQAKEAKEILVRYLEQIVPDCECKASIYRSYRIETLVLMALNSDYFLD